jgi:pyruvate dehydrogenase E2 component (dihydrolipoamide acetyltransferase)
MRGVVREIHVKEGDQAKVGSTILSVDPTGGDQAPESGQKPGEAQPSEHDGKPSQDVAQSAAGSYRQLLTGDEELPPSLLAALSIPPPPSRHAAHAAPAVRRFAREIGIDINQVTGSGPDGRISIEDVKRHAREKGSEKRMSTSQPAPTSLPDFARFGVVERQPMNNIRRKTADHLIHAWTTIPHVTHTDKSDLTELNELRKRLESKAEGTGGKLTILLKIIVAGLKLYPQFNASIDAGKNEIVLKRYYHIGVAVDTDRGLLVPVIRDVDRKSVFDLSVELFQLAEKARQRKLQIAEMQGRSFTITNVGGIGGIYFTPIINEPDVAILGIGRGRMEPVYSEGQFHPRLMLPLSVSYDHRVIDGADAARFTRWLAEAIEDPFLTAMAD